MVIVKYNEPSKESGSLSSFRVQVVPCRWLVLVFGVNCTAVITVISMTFSCNLPLIFLLTVLLLRLNISYRLPRLMRSRTGGYRPKP